MGTIASLWPGRRRKYIQAYITEVHTRAPLNPDVKPDDLILIAEYNQFLEQTG